MSMKRDLHKAYDNIHAPEDVIERMKQELYQKDLHGDAEHEIYRVEKPRSQAGRYFAYIAAVFAVCAGMGLAFQKAQEYRNDFHPGTAVQQTETAAETSASAENEWVIPNVAGYPYTEAQTVLQEAGYTVRLDYEESDTVAADIVIRTYPAAGAFKHGGEVVVYVSRSGEDE